MTPRIAVLVPCYKESVELVKLTVLGAVKAPLPRNTLRTVYLCDDGKVRALGLACVQVCVHAVAHFTAASAVPARGCS